MVCEFLENINQSAIHRGWPYYGAYSYYGGYGYPYYGYGYGYGYGKREAGFPAPPEPRPIVPPGASAHSGSEKAPPFAHPSALKPSEQ